MQSLIHKKLPHVGAALCALSFALLVMPPAPAAAAPSPSPSLDQVLAAPPAGFAAVTTAPFHGEFTAHDYAANSTSSKAAAVESTLNRDGFVDGYGLTWVQRSTGHILIEVVIAFQGGRGAGEWLTAAEVADKADAAYQHPDSISGIGTYYGEHLLYTTNNAVGDAFTFVKGNDLLAVLALSAKGDDVLDLAVTQTKSQFDAAPAATIPSSQWPENASSGSGAADSLSYLFGRLIGYVLILALVVGIVGIVVGVIRRSRRTAIPARPQGAFGPIQLSPDGSYWWDGTTWRSTATDPPPSQGMPGNV